MALFDNRISLYDLLAPILAPRSIQGAENAVFRSSDPDYGLSFDERMLRATHEMQEGERNIPADPYEHMELLASGGGRPSENVAYAEKPSRMDMFTDRLVGPDRYQDLSDEARRRALDMAIMSIGQSLGKAARSGKWSGDDGAAAFLMGAIPDAIGVFEKRLAGEDKYRQDQEDRAYTKGQREFQAEQQKRTKDDWKNTDAARQAINESAPGAIEDAKSFLASVQLSPDDPNYQDAQNAQSQLKRVIMEVENTIKIGGQVTAEQLQALDSAKDRFARATNTENELLQRDMAEFKTEVRKFAIKSGLDPNKPEDIVEAERQVIKIFKQAGMNEEAEKALRLQKARLDMERAELELKSAKDRQALFESMTPDEKKEYLSGIGRAIDPTTGRSVRVPSDGPSAGELSAEREKYKNLRSSRHAQELLAAKNPLDVVIQNPEFVAALQDLGIPAVLNRKLTPQQFRKFRDLMLLGNMPSVASREPVATIAGQIPPRVMALYRKAKAQNKPGTPQTPEEFYRQYQDAGGK